MAYELPTFYRFEIAQHLVMVYRQNTSTFTTIVLWINDHLVGICRLKHFVWRACSRLHTAWPPGSQLAICIQ